MKTVRTPQRPAGWQSWVTMLLIVYLFLLGVGTISNLGGQASPIGRALRRIPGAVPFLQRTGMDLSYEFALASAAPQEAPHQFVLYAPGPEGQVLARLPDASMGRTRAQRYRQLASYAADFDVAFAENPDLRSELPMAVAQAWLGELGLPHDNYRLECRPLVAQRLQPVAPPPDEGLGATASGPIELDLVWSEWESRYQAARRQPAPLTAQPRRTAVSPAAGFEGAEPAAESPPTP